MSPPLVLVRPNTPPVTMHPDNRASAALHTAIQAARKDGNSSGEWAGYMKGWRSGLLCGVCWGGVLTAIGAAAAIHLGWL